MAKKKPSLLDIQAELQNQAADKPVAKYEPAAIVPAATEPERLAELERVIDTNLRAFYEVGYALREIKERALYKAQGFNTFDDYCVQRWDMHRAHAYRLIDSSNVVSNLSPIGDILPERESQVRPLARLPPEQQREVWQKILQGAEDKAKITAKLVEDTVASVTGQVKAPKEKPAGVRASFHFSEDLDDALSASLLQVKKRVGKDKKAQVSKDLIAEVILQHGLEELQAQGENSPLWQAIAGKL